MSIAGKVNSHRDPRIDVLRGFALIMIFVDHIPADKFNRLTLHKFGFCDAAEVFVLLAGMSAMLAYGKIFQRDGTRAGLKKIALRCARIYLFQIGLMLTTLGVVFVWSRRHHMTPKIIAPILGAPVAGLAHGLTLGALPQYLDILPLYIVLLAAFPLIQAAARRSVPLALGGSALLWLAANLFPSLDLPNWMNGQGWYFNPFAWQFLFTIGAALTSALNANGSGLPAYPVCRWFAMTFLVFACLESLPWADWNLPDLRPFAMATPDKSALAPLRILDILALIYLILSAPSILRLARSVWLRPIEACGRHSLEVFSVGCILALFGRLEFRVEGQTLMMQLLVNMIGLGTMCFVGLWLDRGRNGGASAGAASPAVRTHALTTAAVFGDELHGSRGVPRARVLRFCDDIVAAQLARCPCRHCHINW